MNALLEKLSEETALDRVLDAPEVCQFMNFSQPTLDRQVRRGDFPKPFLISARKRGWTVRTVLKVVDERAKAAASNQDL